MPVAGDKLDKGVGAGADGVGLNLGKALLIRYGQSPYAACWKGSQGYPHRA